eukprot:XP_001697279.1 predicted protein [Chlamydomonas reinhardtii]
MSVRRQRGKAAFPPDPNNLGGVQTIIDEYRHMQNRIYTARNQPSSAQLAAVKRYAEDMSLAERLSRNRAARRSAVDPEEMRAWRPSSAPAWAREERGDSYAGWSVRESLGHAFPKSRYAEALKLADHATYKKAIMAEVLDNRLYKEADLRKLFRTTGACA